VAFLLPIGPRLYTLHAVTDSADQLYTATAWRSNWSSTRRTSSRPQKVTLRLFGAIDDIVRRGRKRGIGCTMICRRSSISS